LIFEFIELGFKAVTVCVDERYLDKSYVGKEITPSFVRSLPQGVDRCGEMVSSIRLFMTVPSSKGRCNSKLARQSTGDTITMKMPTAHWNTESTIILRD